MRYLLLLIYFFLCFPAHAETIKLGFEQNLRGWQEKVFNGSVDYQAVVADGHLVLRAESRGKASALIYWQDIDPQRYPTLRWRWKIDKILEKGRAGEKAGDDYPARIYIIYDSWLPAFARSINYIWASKLEREMMVVSPYYRRSVMLAVNSGSEDAGRWVIEERDLRADYRRAFGAEAPLIKAIAIMTDGDDTGENVTAWYDWIEFISAEREP